MAQDLFSPKRCHSKTDEERNATSIHAPFTWECALRVFYVSTMYANQMEATYTMLSHFYQ